MPDYNLGRAHGEISITADTRGAQEAQAAMAATAAEAEVLDKSMGRVNQTFDQNRRSTVLSAEAIVRHRQQLEDLSRTSTRYNDEYQRAVRRTKEAEDALNRARTDEGIKQGALLRLANDVQKARDNEARTLLRMEQSYARYQSRLQNVTQEIANFNRAHIEASSGLNQMRLRMDDLGEAIEKISSKMSSLLRIVGSGGIMGLFVGASSGTTAAFGAGGLSGITSLMAGVAEMVQQLSGVIALLPAVASAAGVGLGTLAVGLHGVGQALSSMGDVNKFIESLRELSPAARQAMEIIYSFTDAMRGARQVIQQSLFAPIVADIQPLIQVWLPQLMRAGQQVGNEFGQMGHQFAQFMLQPQTVQAFNSFIQNMVRGLEAARGAINPLLEAWRTLTTIGSTFFPRIGAAIANIATEFNNWVEAAANSGKLQAWINSALTGFTNLGHVVLNTVEALGNILSIGDRYGGGLLAFVRQLSDEFKAWTVSDKGRETLQNFFQLIQSAGAAVHPILKLLGEGLATVAGAFARLGIAIAPGVTSFFSSIVGALKELAPTIQELGPSISQFLVVFGQSLAQALVAAGPELPTFFKALSQALIGLAPLLPEAVRLIASLLEHLSPGEIQGILLAAGAVRLLAGAFAIFTAALDLNPIVLVIGAIALLAAGVVAAVTNFQGFGDTVANALKPLDEMAGKAYDWGRNLIASFIHGISDMIRPVENVIGQIVQTIRDHLPGSRAKLGPFAVASPEEIGANTAEGFASGLSGGTDAVGAASSGLAGSAAGTSGLGFSSAGLSGKSGQGVGSATGNSGFDRYIKFITDDLSVWSNIFQQSFQLVQSGINTAIQGIKVVASVWGRGDNPLTQPGGILGPPIRWGQQHVEGVPDVHAPGKPPIPALAPLGGPPPGQQDVPGVPSVGPHGQRRGPVLGPPVLTPDGQQNPPAGVQGQAPANAGPAAQVAPGGALSPNQANISSQIISEGRKRGANEDQIRAALAIAADESNLGDNQTFNTSGGNATVGGVGGVFQQAPQYYGGRQNVMDPNVAIPAFWDRFQKNPQYGTNPLAAAVNVQNPQLGANPQGTDYFNAVQRAMGQAPFQAAAGQIGTPQPPTAAPGEAALRPNLDVSGRQGLQPAAQNALQAVSSLFPGITSVGGVRPDSLPYHPEGRALDIMIPDWNTDQGRELGDKVVKYFQDNAGQLGVSDSIFNRQYYQPGQPTVPFQYQGNDPDQAHLTHVHVTFQPGFVPQGLPPGVQPPAAAGVPGLPQIPGLPSGPADTPGGIRIPGANGIGAAAVLGGGVALGGIGVKSFTAARNAGNEAFEAKYQLELLRNGGSVDAAIDSALGIPPGTPQELKGLTTNIGAAPRPGALGSIQGPELPPGLRSPQQLLRPGLQGFGQILQPPSSAKPIDVNIAADGGSALEPSGLSKAVGIGGRLLGPGLAAAGALPFALGAAGNIASNQRVQGGFASIGDLLSGRQSTSHIDTGAAQSPLNLGIPPIGGGGPSRNVGLPSDATDPKKIPQSTVDMAAASGHPIPGTTPSTGLPGGKAAPTAPPAAPAPTWIPGKGFVDSTGKEVPGPGASPAQVQEFNRQRDAQPGQAPAAGQPTPPTSQQQVRLRGVDQPAPPGAQPNIPGAPGSPGSMDYKAVYNQAQTGTGEGAGQNRLPYNAQSPLDAFSSGLASAGNIATDAFTIFNDVITDITATANIGDTLARGIANTEDIVKTIQNIQQYIKTAADVAHLVSDVGGVIAGAGAGDPTGGAGAIGGGIQAIGAIVQSAIEGVNNLITIGIEVYHEVGKYAGYIFGGFLGGPNTGPLGGNVRMLLNTNTNTLQTYSQDNPLNKNLFTVPMNQRSYSGLPPPNVQQSQVNIYTGPGQSPSGMMQESMWMIGTGAAPVASVAGRN